MWLIMVWMKAWHVYLVSMQTSPKSPPLPAKYQAIMYQLFVLNHLVTMTAYSGTV